MKAKLLQGSRVVPIHQREKFLAIACFGFEDVDARIVRLEMKPLDSRPFQEAGIDHTPKVGGLRWGMQFHHIGRVKHPPLANLIGHDDGLAVRSLRNDLCREGLHSNARIAAVLSKLGGLAGHTNRALVTLEPYVGIVFSDKIHAQELAEPIGSGALAVGAVRYIA